MIFTPGWHWQTGMTTIRRSQLDPPDRDYEFGYTGPAIFLIPKEQKIGKLSKHLDDNYKRQAKLVAHLLATTALWVRIQQCWGSRSGIRCLFDPWIRDG
jgi:hypothetical protein